MVVYGYGTLQVGRYTVTLHGSTYTVYNPKGYRVTHNPVSGGIGYTQGTPKGNGTRVKLVVGGNVYPTNITPHRVIRLVHKPIGNLYTKLQGKTVRVGGGGCTLGVNFGGGVQTVNITPTGLVYWVGGTNTLPVGGVTRYFGRLGWVKQGTPVV